MMNVTVCKLLLVMGGGKDGKEKYKSLLSWGQRRLFLFVF